MANQKPNRKKSLEGYTLPIIIIGGIYLGLFFILNYCIIDNRIEISHDVDKVIIRVEKK